MNLYQRLTAALGREQRGVAKITGELGGGSWRARSQSGGHLVLYGETAVGQSVFYDTLSGRVLGQAPDLQVLDLSV